MRIACTLPLFVLLCLAACSTVRQSAPERTAMEQILISTAADRAAENLIVDMPSGVHAYVDAANFDGVDAKYAVAAIRDRLLRKGVSIVDDRAAADAVIAIRAGALSMDEDQTLIGIPQFGIPIPLAGELTFPEIALYKKARQQGVARFAAAAYDAKTGRLIASSGPSSGRSHRTRWVVMLFAHWVTDDAGIEEP
jgi:hypothetical protein